jgi:putative transposase
MRKSNIDQQVIGILREQKVGISTADVCRRYGVSDATFYN